MSGARYTIEHAKSASEEEVEFQVTLAQQEPVCRYRTIRCGC